MNKEPTLPHFSHTKGKIKLLAKEQRVLQSPPPVFCEDKFPAPEDWIHLGNWRETLDGQDCSDFALACPASSP